MALPYQKLPGSRALMLEVRALTKPGDVIAIAVPFPKWEQGYAYLYSRALYPLTGVKCVDRIITDYCVLDVTENGLKLIEVAPGVSVDEVQAMTEPKLIVADNVKEISV